jgi:hypothetical protein
MKCLDTSVLMLIRIIRLLRLQVEITIDAIMMATALIANDLSVAITTLQKSLQ